MEHPDEGGPPANQETLWMIPAAPGVWAAHFLMCYGLIAVWCAKIGGPLQEARIVIAGLTLVALVVIGMIGRWGWRHHAYGQATEPHDFATAADRHRFLGFATLLLSCLSFAGVLFVGLPAAFIESCQ